ncbi:restriction endonuclease subunit S [Terasakiella pusilla]|uniref:restriction endonuclease subunit S n=1 Tax=Terasakiella pusilla TaxID=64973 RepID=UPI003AA83435
MKNKQLPKSWTETKITELLVLNSNGKPFQQGWSPRCETKPAASDEWGVLKTTAIQNGIFWPHENKKLPEKLQARPQIEVKEGDILMTCAGPRSRCGVTCFVEKTDPKLLLSGKMYRFKTEPQIMEAKYLAYFLAEHTTQQHIDRMKTGINDSGLNLTHDRFSKLDVKVAPLNEQRRIVEKIEKLFSELDKGEETLRDVQKLLARYRQSVLKAAVTGELTTDWRAQNAGKLESGQDLLTSILQTRRETWEGRGKYKEPVEPDTTDLPELPKHWACASLDQLIYDGPTNGTSPKETLSGNGCPSFKLTATTSGNFIISEKTIKIVDTEPEADSQYWLKTGDVLIQRGNTIEYVGTAATFPGPDHSYIYPDLMMRVRFTDALIAEWSVLWINFEYAKRHFRRLATGIAGNMPKINGTTLKKLPIPIPPRHELEELVNTIRATESMRKPTNDWCKTELARSKALRQSILKDAFSGRLVPQDESDEPAAKLLARIKQTRASAPKKTKRKASA